MSGAVFTRDIERVRVGSAELLVAEAADYQMRLPAPASGCGGSSRTTGTE
jgi:hypothetical protein